MWMWHEGHVFLIEDPCSSEILNGMQFLEPHWSLYSSEAHKKKKMNILCKSCSMHCEKRMINLRRLMNYVIFLQNLVHQYSNWLVPIYKLSQYMYWVCRIKIFQNLIILETELIFFSIFLYLSFSLFYASETLLSPLRNRGYSTMQKHDQIFKIKIYLLWHLMVKRTSHYVWPNVFQQIKIQHAFMWTACVKGMRHTHAQYMCNKQIKRKTPNYII